MDQYMFSYENHGDNTYLVYRIREEEHLDNVSLGMLTNNKITGFVSVVFTQMNANRFLKYNVSAMISVRQLFMGEIKKKQVISVLMGITDAMMEADDYMINQNLIVLDLDYIFTDIVSCETSVICLPVEKYGEETWDLKLFLKKIMGSIQFDPSENGDYVAKIMNLLNSGQTFTLREFKSLLEEIQGEEIKKKLSSAKSKENYGRETTPQFQNLKPEKKFVPYVKEVGLVKEEPDTIDGKQISLFYLLQHYNKENAALYKEQREERKNKKKQKAEQSLEIEKKSRISLFKRKKSVDDDMGFAVPGEEKEFRKENDIVPKSVSFGKMDQSVTGNVKPNIPKGEEMDYGETVLLEEDMTQDAGTELMDTGGYPYLIRTANHEKVNITKDYFRIGKDESYADLCLKNPAISHKHACIVRRGNDYYIIDTNSKNHTYVEGIRIQSNTETKLENGVKFCLAKEEFEFHLY